MTLISAAFASILFLGSAYVQAGTYSDWAVIVVAGDWHAHDGSPSEIFDNARRDVSTALVNAGFNPANVVQFSVRPDHYPATHPLEAEAGTIADTLSNLAARARGGCMLYFSSHGAPSGLVLGERILTPVRLDNIVSLSCGERPTVVVISSCYSGVFVNALARPNRMIITAARRDRTSFGCGGTNRYPYFDACFLAAMPEAKDFRTAAVDADRCVARLERQTRMSPPSDPQIFVGRQIAARLPAWR
ncbi:MAG: C13 family peptidase [Rhizomicrobium sp.]